LISRVSLRMSMAVGRGEPVRPVCYGPSEGSDERMHASRSFSSNGLLR